MLRQTETDRQIQRDSFGLGNNYTYIQTTTKQQQKVVGARGRGHKYLKNYYVYTDTHTHTQIANRKKLINMVLF